MKSASKTPRMLIQWGAEQFERAGLFFGHGTDNALDEAAALVLHALQIDYGEPDAVLDQSLDAADYSRVTTLLEERLTSRKPAAYLLQEAWFAGKKYFVDERVLLPRSPIAELIHRQFIPWIEPQRVSRILDLCTGSGCIGIACADAFPAASVDIADLSRDALSVARINISRHGHDERMQVHESDVFSALPTQGYDIIVSNPPYVPRDELEDLPAEYRHEPAVGLVAGEDGLDIVVQILKGAAGYLADDGILIVEVGHSQVMVQSQYPDVPFLWLELEFGGSGVFLLEAAQVAACQSTFNRVAVRRAATKQRNEVNSG